MSEQRLLFATTNPNKVREVREILSPLGLRITTLEELQTSLPEPEEDGETFEQNARIKARAYAKATGQRCLAEDSGLEVDALGGRPGVHSARYAGKGATRSERDEQNNKRLLAELAEVPEERRTARFVCVMCVAEPDGAIIAETRGEFAGRIAPEQAGSSGFGYDPLLYVPELARTSAELSPEEKNARSHRGAAARALLQALSS